MADWPSGWREATLRAADIPVTQFALDMMSAWQRSTPLQPWTDNPLGFPAGFRSAPSVYNTKYALFPSMQAFRVAFVDLMSRPQGRPVRDALSTQDKPSVIWRAVRALGWPANDTETDYPSAILDQITIASDVPASAVDPSERKSVGLIGDPDSTNDAILHAMRTMTGIAQSGTGVHEAIRSLVRKVN